MGKNALIEAVLTEHLEEAHGLIDRHAVDIDEKDHKGGTALLYASSRHPCIVKRLLDLGADPQVRNFSGFNVLHVCALSGNHAAAELLVKAGADLGAIESTSGTEPLHLAAQRGHVEVMVIFLRAGARLDRRTTRGETALFLAAVRGEVGAVRELLRCGANPLKKCGGFTPLMGAVSFGHVDVACEFREWFGGFADCGGDMALVSAAEKQHVGIIELLLDHGVCDSRGYALSSAIVKGREESINLLLRRNDGSTLDLKTYVNNARHFNNVYSALECCFQHPRQASPRIVRRLIEAGIAHDVIFDDYTPLKFAENFVYEKTGGYGFEVTDGDKYAIGMQGIRRVLLQLAAVHAVSWGWVDIIEDAQDAKDAKTFKDAKIARDTKTIPKRIKWARKTRPGLLLLDALSRKKKV